MLVDEAYNYENIKLKSNNDAEMTGTVKTLSKMPNTESSYLLHFSQCSKITLRNSLPASEDNIVKVEPLFPLIHEDDYSRARDKGMAQVAINKYQQQTANINSLRRIIPLLPSSEEQVNQHYLSNLKKHLSWNLDFINSRFAHYVHFPSLKTSPQNNPELFNPWKITQRRVAIQYSPIIESVKDFSRFVTDDLMSNKSFELAKIEKPGFTPYLKSSQQDLSKEALQLFPEVSPSRYRPRDGIIADPPSEPPTPTNEAIKYNSEDEDYNDEDDFDWFNTNRKTNIPYPINPELLINLLSQIIQDMTDYPETLMDFENSDDKKDRINQPKINQIEPPSFPNTGVCKIDFQQHHLTRNRFPEPTLEEDRILQDWPENQSIADDPLTNFNNYN